MATYYIRKTGSDGAAGTSAGTAWLTLGKALGASGIASGDTVYVGGGTYREVVTVAMTSAVAETSILADVDGSHTGDAGEVIWTAYTTNDSTAPSATALLNLSQRDFLTFQGFTMVGGTGITIRADTAGAVSNTFRDCTILHTAGVANQAVYVLSSAGVALNWTFDRCRIISAHRTLHFELATHSAHYDVNVTVKDCLLISTAFANVQVGSNGALSSYGGGVDLMNCTLVGGDTSFITAATNSATFPCTITNSLVLSGSGLTALQAGLAGNMTEDYNIISSGTPRHATGPSVGTHSISDGSRAMAIHLGQEAYWGGNLRHCFAPVVSSPILGFGTTTGASTVDLLNRTRPSGGASSSPAAGALERHDFAISPGTTVGSDTGTGYIELVGVGDHDFELPVDASATTITIKTKTSGYTGTNYPQMLIVNGGQAGVADASVAATSASASAYESISIGPFTPTSKGIITVRLTNRSANGTGIAAFDTFSVS